MDRRDVGVGIGRQERVKVASDLAPLVFRTEVQFVHMPANAASGQLSYRRKRTTPEFSLCPAWSRIPKMK
jgi:hypothetical protein